MTYETTQEVIDDLNNNYTGEGDHPLAASFKYLQENVEAFENGDMEIGDLPVDEETEVLVRIAVMFGVLWEREYPDDQYDVLVDRTVHILELVAQHHPDKQDQFEQDVEAKLQEIHGDD